MIVKSINFTGDLANIVDGRLFFYGRNDDQVKVRGIRFDLGEVEMILKKLSHFENFAVIFHPETERIILFLEGSDEMVDLDFDAHLSSYMIPSEVIRIPKLPLLASGKIDKVKLKQLHEEKMRLKTYENEAEDEMSIEETKLLAVLRVENMSLSASKSLEETSFFEMGGNSLNAVLIISKLRSLGYEIRIREFLAAKSLSDIVNLMRSDTGQRSSSEPDHVFIPLSKVEKSEGIEIVASTFSRYGDLELMLVGSDEDKQKSLVNEFRMYLASLWDYFLEDMLSVGILHQKSKRLVGISLSLDISTQPEIPLPPTIEVIVKFLDSIETPVVNYLREERRLEKMINNILLAVDDRISSADKVLITLQLEKIMIEEGLKRNYDAIVTCNTNPLTQQLAVEELGYTVQSTVKVKGYSVNGDFPFRKSSEDQIVPVCYKELYQR